MKLFFYKSLIVVFLFLITFHLSFGYLHKKIKSEIYNNFSKENVEYIIDKIRLEIKNAIDKDVYIKPSDANLINQFLDKIKSDLNKNK
tara:strand:+ start:495 stop:758 length:264 start_codon:yes stop_codon:yes gene_type:complete